MPNPLDNTDSAHGKFFQPLCKACLDSEHQYLCASIDDADYARLGILRCITSASSGHEFLQNHGLESGEFHEGGHFFKALKSERRLANLT